MTTTSQPVNKVQSMKTWAKAAPNIYRYVPTGTYYIRLKLPSGKRIQQSLETTDLPTAKRKAADKKAAALHGKNLSKGTSGGSSGLHDVMDKWFEIKKQTVNQGTAQRISYSLKALKPILSNMPISRCTLAHVEDWCRQRGQVRQSKNRGRPCTVVSASTFNKELEVLNAVFNYAVEHNLIGANPIVNIQRLRKPMKITRIHITENNEQVPSTEELEKLIACIRQWGEGRSQTQTEAADFVAVMAYSGMRCHEASELRWSDINFESGEMKVRGTKTKSSDRVMPLNPKLTAVLKDMQGRRVNGDKVFTAEDARYALPAACQELYGDHLKWSHHDMRHYFITRCIEAKTDIPTLAKWVGHADGGHLILRTYVHTSTAHSKQMAAKLTF